MEVYKTVPKFSQRTGKKEADQKAWKETRCDFTGTVVDTAEHEEYPGFHCKFVLDYGDQDPCMGSSDEEFEFGDKYKVNMFAFLNEPYTILNDAAGDRGSAYPKFFTQLKKHGSLESALRAMRIVTATKLIEAGEVKPEELTNDTF